LVFRFYVSLSDLLQFIYFCRLLFLNVLFLYQ
jgi:hypothetical protein